MLLVFSEQNMTQKTTLLLFGFLVFNGFYCFGFVCTASYKQYPPTGLIKYETPCSFFYSVFAYASWKATGVIGTPNFGVGFLSNNLDEPVLKIVNAASSTASVVSLNPHYYVTSVATVNANLIEPVNVEITVYYLPIWFFAVVLVIVCCCFCCFCCCCCFHRRFGMKYCCGNESENEERLPLRPKVETSLNNETL